MNPSQIEISIDGIEISLYREKTIKPDYQFYYAERVPIKPSQKLNQLFVKYIPECERKFSNRDTGRDHTISAEKAVRSILAYQFPTLKKYKFEYDGKWFKPDGVVIDRDNPQKPNYLFEIKTTSSRPITKLECLIKVAGLQALRNSSAIIMAGVVDSIFPKAVIAEYEQIPIQLLARIKPIGDQVVVTISDDEKIPIMVKRITMYRVRVCDSFMLDRDLASLVYKYLRG